MDPISRDTISRRNVLTAAAAGTLATAVTVAGRKPEKR